jgi:hypothetical protein
MILLFDVHQLVDEHIIAHIRRHLQQPKIQCDVAIPGARSPARSLVPNGHATDAQAVSIGKRPKPVRQVDAGKLPKIRFDCLPDVCGTRGNESPTSIHDDGLVAATVDGDAYERAVQQNLGAVLPLAWTVLDEHAPALTLDPSLLPLDELLRFTT